MILNFSDIQWHDSKIKSCLLESKRSSFDTILLTLECDSYVDQFGQKEIQVVFKDCHSVKIDFHLWITHLDTIKSAELIESSPWIDEEKRKLGINFGNINIWHLIIKTNTNSSFEFLVTRKNSIEVLSKSKRKPRV